jgi:hypothetical protein
MIAGNAYPRFRSKHRAVIRVLGFRSKKPGFR